MRPISRREFLSGAAAGGTLLGLGAGALAQSDKFDLVVKGGEVLDPGQKLRARRDVGIRNAVIAALEPEIPDARAKQTLDPRWKLVLPGLIERLLRARIGDLRLERRDHRIADRSEEHTSELQSPM